MVWMGEAEKNNFLLCKAGHPAPLPFLEKFAVKGLKFFPDSLILFH